MPRSSHYYYYLQGILDIVLIMNIVMRRHPLTTLEFIGIGDCV